jgi:hypothetical protein
MPKNILVLLASVLMLCAGVSQAREFGGMQFDEKRALPGATQTAQLNGIGALYTERLARTRDEVFALAGPKRVLKYFFIQEYRRAKRVMIHLCSCRTLIEQLTCR